MLLILTKLFFTINCVQASAVTARMNYYTYLYRRNQWLKPLDSDSLYDKCVNARIHVTQLSFIILF